MHLPQILENEELRLREFPVAKDKIFLAHGGVSPLPQRVSDRISAYALQAATGDQEAFVYPAGVEEGRALAGRLLGCKPNEVAFVGPTSLALSIVASGLKFRRSENILVYFDDYPSNVYPWMALAEQGVQVRLLNTRGLGLICAKDVMGQVDENTRLVALASCHFISGYRIELDAIGKYLRERGILFCVDGIQTVGAFPTTVENIDMLAADAHKWLLGPCGAGLLYIRESVQETLNPPLFGWHNVRSPDFVAQDQIVFRKGAHKFEAGTHNLVGMVGLLAAIELLLEVGVENIGRELVRKRDFLVPALQGKGYRVLHADSPPEARSGITSFFRPGEDLSPVHKRLLDEEVFTSLRTDRTGQKYIRLSPHFYNTDRELQRVLDLI